MTDSLSKLFFLFAYTYLIVFYYAYVNGRSKIFTPISIFLLYQFAQFVSMVFMPNAEQYSFYLTRIFSMLIGSIFIVLGCVFANIVSNFKPTKAFKAFANAELVFDIQGGIYVWLIIAMGLICCLVGIVYVFAIGYNAPLDLIGRFSESGDLRQTSRLYSQLRTSVATGSYVAPGYVAQFTRILLSVIFFQLYIRSLIKKTKVDAIVTLVVLLLCVYFLTVAGIRSYLVIFAITFWVLNSKTFGTFGKLTGSLGRYVSIIVLVVAFSFFAVFSILGGRADINAGAGSGLGAVLSDFLDRVLLVASRNQLIVMEYFMNMPPRLGQGWVDSLGTLLPGTRLGLSNEIFYIIYGSRFGNAPVDLWTSIWLEFQWFGIIGAPLVIGFLLQKLTIHFVTGEKTISRMIIFLMATFALVDVNDPLALFNNGFVTLMIYYSLTYLIKAYDDQVLNKRFYRSHSASKIAI